MGRETQGRLLKKHQYVVGRAAMPAGEGGCPVAWETTAREGGGGGTGVGP